MPVLQGPDMKRKCLLSSCAGAGFSTDAGRDELCGYRSVSPCYPVGPIKHDQAHEEAFHRHL